jgi:hypothetical protein
MSDTIRRNERKKKCTGTNGTNGTIEGESAKVPKVPKQILINHLSRISMAQFETSAGIEGITGKLNKRQSLTSRQKHFHYPDGRIFGCGPKEVYEQQQRDFKRNPRTPAEEAQHQRWTAACREAALITKDPNHPRYAEMVSRHASQLDGQPDPVLGKKRICQFSNFVRAVLIHES